MKSKISEATLSEKGQVTIPKNVRDTLNLQTGDKVEFYHSEYGVILDKQIQDRTGVSMINLSSALVPSHQVVIFNGKTRWGKSTLIRKILEKNYKNAKLGLLGISWSQELYMQITDWGIDVKDTGRIMTSDNRSVIGEHLNSIDLLLIDESAMLGLPHQLIDLLMDCVKDTGTKVFIETHKFDSAYYSPCLEFEFKTGIREDSDYRKALKIKQWEKSANGVPNAMILFEAE